MLLVLGSRDQKIPPRRKDCYKVSKRASRNVKNAKRVTSKQKKDLDIFPTVSDSDMELANDFSEHFTNISTTSTPSSIYSRVHNHRHDGNSFTFTEISVDQDVDKLKAIQIVRPVV